MMIRRLFTLNLSKRLAAMTGGLALMALATFGPLPAREASPSRSLIIGYMPDWQGDINAIQYDKLTHICYAFLLAKPDGTLDTASIKLDRMQQLTAQAHAKNVKVIISLGGWSNGTALMAAMRNSITRAALATNCLEFIEKYGLDGFDFDWEGPANLEDGAAWSAFMKTMYGSLHPKGKVTTTAIAAWFGQNIPTSAYAYLDFANIMAYDNEGNQHSDYEFTLKQVKYWMGQGIPMNKIVLGVPFYGYPVGSREGVPYHVICAGDPEAQKNDQSKNVYYNGIPTIQKKAAYVVEQKAAGIMMWELSQDATGDKSLLSALHAVITGTKSDCKAADPASKPVNCKPGCKAEAAAAK